MSSIPYSHRYYHEPTEDTEALACNPDTVCIWRSPGPPCPWCKGGEPQAMCVFCYGTGYYSREFICECDAPTADWLIAAIRLAEGVEFNIARQSARMETQSIIIPDRSVQ